MKPARTLTDMRESLRRATCQKSAKQMLGMVRCRLADIEFIGWPALEESLRRELEDCQEIARAKGFVA